MYFRSKYFTTIEVKVPANALANKNFNFDTQSQVQTIIGDQRVLIEAIETFSITQLTNSPLTSSNPVAAAADITKAVLTLRFGSFEGMSQRPLASMCRGLPNTGASYSPAVFELATFRDMTKIDWTKSYVTLVANATTLTTFSFVFGVYYDYLPV